MDCKCQVYTKYPVDIVDIKTKKDMTIVHCVCENCGNEWVE